MLILDPVIFNDEKVVVRAFIAEDFNQFDHIAEEVFKLLTDDLTLQFLPEKRLYSFEEAKGWLQSTILNFHSGRTFTYFVRVKKKGNLIGLIDLHSPDLARDHYNLFNYPYFIEFYLKGNAQGLSLMSGILPIIVNNILQQGIPNIAAVVNRRNFPARKVLQKSGFIYQSFFDQFQDLFQTQASI